MITQQQRLREALAGLHQGTPGHPGTCPWWPSPASPQDSTVDQYRATCQSLPYGRKAHARHLLIRQPPVRAAFAVWCHSWIQASFPSSIPALDMGPSWSCQAESGTVLAVFNASSMSLMICSILLTDDQPFARRRIF